MMDEIIELNDNLMDSHMKVNILIPPDNNLTPRFTSVGQKSPIQAEQNQSA